MGHGRMVCHAWSIPSLTNLELLMDLILLIGVSKAAEMQELLCRGNPRLLSQYYDIKGFSDILQISECISRQIVDEFKHSISCSASIRSPENGCDTKELESNPEWNTDFNLYVIDPDVQVLEILVRNWKKYGIHDRMGMSVIPLKDLITEERKSLNLDLLAYKDSSNSQKKKSHGQITVEILYNTLVDDKIPIDFPVPSRKPHGGGLLILVILECENLEGKYHTNPSVSFTFQGKLRKPG
ncbi:synaptotagmin-2-like protein isoform X2 [Tanacetum coccineum]